jgi:hypothetical protein
MQTNLQIGSAEIKCEKRAVMNTLKVGTWQQLETMCYPVSVPSGTPVTNVGLEKFKGEDDIDHKIPEGLKETGRVHHSHLVTIIAQSEVEEIVKMGRDGNEHMLVERELLLDVGKQRVDLGRVCVVHGGSDGHGERARDRARARNLLYNGGGPI